MPKSPFGSCAQCVVWAPSASRQRRPPFFAANADSVPAAVAVMYSPPRESAMKSGWAFTTASSGRDHASVRLFALTAVTVLCVAMPLRAVEFPQVDQSARGALACAALVRESTSNAIATGAA